MELTSVDKIWCPIESLSTIVWQDQQFWESAIHGNMPTGCIKPQHRAYKLPPYYYSNSLTTVTCVFLNSVPIYLQRFALNYKVEFY